MVLRGSAFEKGLDKMGMVLQVSFHKMGMVLQATFVLGPPTWRRRQQTHRRLPERGRGGRNLWRWLEDEQKEKAEGYVAAIREANEQWKELEASHASRLNCSAALNQQAAVFINGL